MNAQQMQGAVTFQVDAGSTEAERFALGLPRTERIGLLLNQLATMASEAAHLTAQLQCRALPCGLVALETLCQHMGWLADATAESLGCTSVRGADPLKWFAFDSHRVALQSLEDESERSAAQSIADIEARGEVR